MSLHQPFSKEGCTIFVKTGHLLEDGGGKQAAYYR